MSDTGPVHASRTIETIVEKYTGELVDFRRDLHAHPELSWAEERTPQVVATRRAELAEATLAGETHARQVQLVKTGDTPRARLDEATRDLETDTRKREAADAELDASVVNYDDVLVILLSDVASNYVQYRTFEERLFFARSNAIIQRNARSD